MLSEISYYCNGISRNDTDVVSKSVKSVAINFYAFTAMHSTSTKASLGSVRTATAERAG